MNSLLHNFGRKDVFFSSRLKCQEVGRMHSSNTHRLREFVPPSIFGRCMLSQLLQHVAIVAVLTKTGLILLHCPTFVASSFFLHIHFHPHFLHFALCFGTKVWVSRIWWIFNILYFSPILILSTFLVSQQFNFETHYQIKAFRTKLYILCITVMVNI